MNNNEINNVFTSYSSNIDIFHPNELVDFGEVVCNDLYFQIGDKCYLEEDIDFLKELVELNETLDILFDEDVLHIGSQIWEGSWNNKWLKGLLLPNYLFLSKPQDFHFRRLE